MERIQCKKFAKVKLRSIAWANTMQWNGEKKWKVMLVTRKLTSKQINYFQWAVVHAKYLGVCRYIDNVFIFKT